jgi:hypothetical protein
VSKRNLDWTLEKYNRFLKEGRGKGEEANYKPWLTIQDFPSRGRVSRIFSFKTGRIHHFFTDNEARCFYLMAFQENVIDIREHYPLLDLNEVIIDKEDLDFEKYRSDGTNASYVLTTSFLITLKDEHGKYRYIARSVKASYELDRKSIIERFEFERRYWDAKKVSWGIITEKDINVVKAKNIEWVYPSLELNNNERFSNEERIYLCNMLIKKLQNSSEVVRKITSELDKELNLEEGTGILLLKYLIATKQIEVDMDKKIDGNQSANTLLKIHERNSKNEYAINS